MEFKIFYPQLCYVITYTRQENDAPLLFRAYKVRSTSEEDGVVTPHEIEDDPIITGHLKMDGCIEVYFTENEHFCGLTQCNQFCSLFSAIYEYGKDYFTEFDG